MPRPRISDAEGLAGWLGDAVDLEAVVPGASGTVCEGGAVRRLVVTERGAGHRRPCLSWPAW